MRQRVSPVPGLTFSHLTASGLEVVARPISQFDMTVNHVCRECNQGWLNGLQGRLDPLLANLLSGTGFLDLNTEEAQALGFWAFVRAIVRTHMSPGGHAPIALAAWAYEQRTVPPGCYVSLAMCGYSVWEAGTHQSYRLPPENDYIAFVALGLGALQFRVALSTGGAKPARLGREAIRGPRLWFPGTARWLVPPEAGLLDLRLLTSEEAQVAGAALMIRMGLEPRDQFGKVIDVASVVPSRFLSLHAKAASGIGAAGATPRPELDATARPDTQESGGGHERGDSAMR